MSIVKSLKLYLLPLLALACTTDNPIPKPKAYPKLDFPQKKYTWLSNPQYQFKIPTYFSMIKDTLSTGESPNGWYNLSAKPYNATVHLTYHNLYSAQDLDSLIRDTRRLVNKQIDKATDIEEIPMQQFNAAYNGIYFNILGNTATNLNFYITDNTKHFLRGALYFNYAATADSIQPIYQFLKTDVDTLLKSLQWKN